MRMNSVKLFVLLLMVCATPSWGAVYYVSSSDGDTSFDGLSTSTPFETVAQLYGVLSTGDSVLFKRGDTFPITTYGVYINFNSTEVNPTVIGSYGTGNKPVLTASGQTGDGTRGNLSYYVPILFAGGSGDWVTIENLDLRAPTDELAIDGYQDYGNRQHVTVQNCYITGDGFEGQGLVNIHGDYIHVLSNHFDNSSHNVFNIGLEVAGATSVAALEPVVRGNHFENCAASGGAIRLVHTDGAIIEGNWVEGRNSGCPSAKYFGIVPRDPLDSGSGLATTIVRNNIVDLSDIVECTTGSDCSYGLNTWTVLTGSTTMVLYIENNTFIGHGYGSGLKLQGDLDPSVYQSGDIRNNIFVNFQIAIEVDNSLLSGGHFGAWNNNYYGCDEYYTTEDVSVFTDNGGGRSSDPQFAGGAHAGAFALSDTSPCIDAGVVSADTPEEDYTGNARGVTDSQVDVGALEHGATTSFVD